MIKKTTNAQTTHSRKLRAKTATAWSKKQYAEGKLGKLTITGNSQEILEIKNWLNAIKKKQGGGYCSALYSLMPKDVKLNRK